MADDSKCFLESLMSFKAGHIREEEHFRNLLAHFQGVRHRKDETPEPALFTFAPFTASMRRAAIEQGVVIDDVEPFARLLGECIEQDNISLARIRELLGTDHAPKLIQPLIIFAAERNKTEVLKYCIENGASIDDPYFFRAVVVRGNTSTAMLDLLWGLDWRNMRSNQIRLSELLAYSWTGESDVMLSWLLEHGAVVTKSLVILKAPLATTPEKLSVFIRKGGIDAFTDSGALQYYATRGRTDLARILLDAGADINELPTCKDIRERGPFSALYQATAAGQVEMVQFLLERGANMDLRNGEETRMADGEWLDASSWELAQRMRDGEAMLNVFKATSAADAKE